MSLEPRKRILNITDVAAELTKFLYEYPLSPSSLAKGSEIAAAMTETMIEDNSCVVALGMLASHDWYTYYHSARVASYSLALAIEMGLTDRDQLEELSLGCLFHDVGKSRIDLNILNKAGPLSSGEWSLVREHPKHGIVVIDATKLGVIPREVILHHHERLDGAGYPHNLKPNELLTEVRIASFADTFDALTTNRPYQPSRTRFEALELIRNRFLAQLDPECFKAMVALFKKASHLKDAS
jgi:HD-GYP domain-containing protein (c-di-GMP phosphodiesterase class II)